MIIILEASDADLQSLKNDEAEDIFSILIDADRCGRHLVIISRSICTWASSNLNLSGQNKNHLNRLREGFATRGAISRDASCFIKLKIGGPGISIKDGFFEISHDEFMRGEYAQSKSKMIVENLTADSKLYEFLFEVSAPKTKVPNWSVDFVMGGGDTTVTAFESEILKKRVTVCVVDSDKIAPCDHIGETAKKVLRRHHKRNIDQIDATAPYIGAAIETIGHEIENYIPMCAVKKLTTFVFPKELDGLADQSFIKESSECLWLYYDIKDGIDGMKIEAKINDGKKTSGVKSWLVDKTRIPADNFNTLKISGIGKTVVQHFLKSESAKSEYILFSNTEYWYHLFLKHFESILWFFAASVKSRI